MDVRRIWTGVSLSIVTTAALASPVLAQQIGSGVVIADDRADAILVSTVLGEFDTAYENIDDPVGVAIDETGIVYALSAGSGELLRLVPNEQPRVIVGNLNEPRALVLGLDGFLYVSAGTSVFSITTTGSESETIVSGLTAPDAVALWSPPGATSGMLIGANGVSPSIVLVPFDGSPIKTLVEDFGLIGGIGTVPGRGEFYVTDTKRNEILAINPLKGERRVIQDSFPNPGAVTIFPPVAFTTDAGFSIGVSLGSDIVALDPVTGTGIDIGTAIFAAAIVAVPELTHPGTITGEVPLGTARPIIQPEPKLEPEPKFEPEPMVEPRASRAPLGAVFGGLATAGLLGLFLAAVFGMINAFLRRPLDAEVEISDGLSGDSDVDPSLVSASGDPCAELRAKIVEARRWVDQLKPEAIKTKTVAEKAQKKAQEAGAHIAESSEQEAYEAAVLNLQVLTRAAGESAMEARKAVEVQEEAESVEKRIAASLIRCEIAEREKMGKGREKRAPAKPISEALPESQRCCPGGTWVAYGWTSSGSFIFGKETTQVTFICLEDPKCSVVFAWESFRIGFVFGGDNRSIGGVAINVCGSGEIEALLEEQIWGIQGDFALGLSAFDIFGMRGIAGDGRHILKVLRRLGRKEAKLNEVIWHISDIKSVVRTTLARKLRHEAKNDEAPGLALFPLGPSAQIGVWKRVRPELYFVERSGDCN